MDINEIGLIYDMTNPEEPIALDGWHVNSLQPLENANEFLVFVRTPSHGFFGIPDEDVYHYKFDSKEQAKQYLPQQEEVI